MDLYANICEWAKFNYCSLLEKDYKSYKNDFGYTNVDKEVAIKVLKDLGIDDKIVNGKSVEKLATEAENHVSISYTELFYTLLSKNYDAISPANFILLIISNLRIKGSMNNRNGIVARGLRTYASFIRELAFKEEINVILNSKANKFTLISNPNLDAKYHTDLEISTATSKFHIWLYQFSKRGLIHDVDRFTGNRGALPAGLHILCPLISDNARLFTEYCEKQKKNTNKIVKLNSEMSCINNNTKKYLALKDRLDKLTIKESDLKHNIQETIQNMQDQVEIKEEWYLYSKNYIHNVASALKKVNRKNFSAYTITLPNLINPMPATTILDYSKVKSVLLFAEYLFSSVRIVKVD